MIKVHIITQNEPFYIPKMIKYLIENQNKSYKICSYTILNPSRKNKSLKHWFYERALLYSYVELIIVGFAFLFSKTISFLRIHTNYDSKMLFSKANISQIKTKNVNNKFYIKKVKENNPDIILSISCPQLFKHELISVPKICCINAHGTLLPRHRGVFGSFWTLFYDDKEAGGTIHKMELRLDDGEIIWQKSFPVLQSDTQFSIAYKTKKLMAYGLEESFEAINKGQKTIQPNVHYLTSYHRSPTLEQAKDFKRKGKSIVRLSDLRLMLSKFY